MKKYITLLIFLLQTVVCLAQTDYDRGFKIGYKEGYCYNDFGCISPISPITPIPYIGESNDNYQDGYNRGFKMGLEEKNANKNKSSNYNGGKNSSSSINWSQPISMHVPIDQSVYAALYEDAARKSAASEENMKRLDIVMNYVKEIENKSTDKELLNAAKGVRSKLEKYGENNPHVRMSDVSSLLSEVENDLLTATEKASKKLELKTLYDEAIAALKNKNYNEGIYKLSNLISLDAQNPYLYYLRGRAYRSNNAYPLSIVDFDKSLDLKSEQPKVLEARGWSKYYIKDYMGSLADFNKQIELEPSESAYYNRGSAKSELGDQPGAINDYNKAIELKPEYSMAYNNIAWSLYIQKNYQEALKMVNKAIVIDPNNTTAFDSRQEIKFALNDFQGCIDDCYSVIIMDSKNSNSYFFRGRANYKLGNKTKACEDWSKAGELGKAEAYDFIKKFCK